MINIDTSAKPAPDAGETTSAPIRLWLVDDNVSLRNTVAELLARERAVECTRSFSSATALLSALASKIGPDVILLDIQMGDENGLAFCSSAVPSRKLSKASASPVNLTACRIVAAVARSGVHGKKAGKRIFIAWNEHRCAVHHHRSRSNQKAQMCWSAACK